MNREPLISLQRRLSIVGEIRAGEKGDRGEPKKRSTWRLTSSDESLLEQAAGLYGGAPAPWASPAGPRFELKTTAAELAVLVMPGYSFSQRYERWEGMTKCVRACDGIDEERSGEECFCNRADFDGEPCDLYTRLTVALPELTTLLGWRLVSKGENAARELGGSMELANAVGQGRPFVPGKLRLTERRGVVDGSTVRYVVPVLDFALGYSELAAGTVAPLAAGGVVPKPAYTPLAISASGGTSVADALAATDRQADPAARTARSAPPIGAAIGPVTAGAVPVEDGGTTAPAPATRAKAGEPTKAQLKKLDVLVGTLRDGGHITTEQLYSRTASRAELEPEALIELVEGSRDAAGVLHWAPLRDTLTREQASELIGALERYEQNIFGSDGDGNE